MAQFYNIEWVSDPSDTPDKYGNHWYTVKIGGRNIRTLAKNEPTTGQTYGEITEETSQAGKKYYRFRRKQVPDGVQPPHEGVIYSEGTQNSQSFDGQSFDELIAIVRENNRLLKQLQGDFDDTPVDDAPPHTDADKPEEVDLSDIPF